MLLVRQRPRTAPEDPLEEHELAKDRARLLLQRYGVLFRELTRRELPALQWGRLFRALRLMELGGEIVSGQFFQGVQGLQFATPETVGALRRGLAGDAIFWMSAVDPAAPCGLGLPDLPAAVPRRLLSNHLVYHGSRLVVVSERHAARLSIAVDPGHPHLDAYLGFLSVLLTRRFNPRSSLAVETINEEPAASSPYAGALGDRFHVIGGGGGELRLWRSYGEVAKSEA